jgi:hypothetical protein
MKRKTCYGERHRKQIIWKVGRIELTEMMVKRKAIPVTGRGDP